MKFKDIKDGYCFNTMGDKFIKIPILYHMKDVEILNIDRASPRNAMSIFHNIGKAIFVDAEEEVYQ